MKYDLLLINIAVFAPAIILHECAHGWVANKLGDPTAKNLGRLTLNPLKHIDPFGTIILPFMLWLSGVTPFGWAKPIPVNPMNFTHPKRDMMWVGLAGPAVNIVLAVILSQFLKLDLSGDIQSIIQLAILINLFLAVFNMVPIPPLDGSRLVIGLLPNRYAYLYSRLEPVGIILVFLLFVVGKFQILLLPVIDYLASFLGVS